MSDTTVNQFVGRGTAADMAAFTPTPPSPSNAPPLNGYTFFNTDDGILYSWDGAAWVAPAGSGTVTNTGTLTAGVNIIGNGGTDITISSLTAAVVGSTGGVLASASAAVTTRVITFAIDGAGLTIATGIKADVYVPYACTMTAVTMLADQSGSMVVDIWKKTRATYPPTVANTITAAAKPTIAAATNSQDTTLTGWTTAVAADDTLRFNVDSCTTITRLHLGLTVVVT